MRYININRQPDANDDGDDSDGNLDKINVNDDNDVARYGDDSDDNLDKIKDRYVGWDRDDENLCME